MGYIDTKANIDLLRSSHKLYKIMRKGLIRTKRMNKIKRIFKI